MLYYLSYGYRNILGYQCLLRYLKDSPCFYDAIRQYVCRPKIHFTVDKWKCRSPGLSMLPFNIFGFIDCSITRTNVPFSGPDGDYEGHHAKHGTNGII